MRYVTGVSGHDGKPDTLLGDEVAQVAIRTKDDAGRREIDYRFIPEIAPERPLDHCPMRCRIGRIKCGRNGHRWHLPFPDLLCY